MKRFNFAVTDEVAAKVQKLVIDKISKTNILHSKTELFIEAIELLYNRRFNENK